ncbi:MAG: metallophosphoesterase [Verrucomicrobiales bacterium]
MQTRRQHLASLGTPLTLPALNTTAQTETRPLFSFGLMSDCQYVDSERKGSRFYRESPAKLEAAIKVLSQRELAFTFHLGDFIDRDFDSFERLDPIASKLTSPLYHALGNHDFEVEDTRKQDVLNKLGLEKGYYSLQKAGFRFLILDTTEVSTYRYSKGSEAQSDAAAELKRLQHLGNPGSKPWNGRPGDHQMRWMESELIGASKAGETVLVFGHHPVLPQESHAVWNASAVNALFQKHTCAKLYINGHNHAGHYLDSEGLHYLTLDGMVETKDTNAFAIADLYSDRLEINGFGRQGSHILKFR